MAGKEADPITLIKKSNWLYRGKVQAVFRLDAGAVVHLQGDDVLSKVWQWRVLCPHCDQLIEMSGEQLILDDDATAESVPEGNK